MRRSSLLAFVVAVLATAGLAASAITGVGSSGEAVAADPPTVGLVDPTQGLWHLRDTSGNVKTFFFGNPGDFPIVGDWDCDGFETPGMYRQDDGYVYLSNANKSQVADIRFFFGNPGDIPLAGDFDGDGCDTVSIYRPAEGRVFIINELGKDEGGLGAAERSYYFGDPGDKPFVGDFDGDGVETVGLHRESTGLVYFNNAHRSQVADAKFIFGDPGDRLVAGDWTVDGVDTPALFRPSNTTFYFRYTNTQGNADHQFQWGQVNWLPVAGTFGVKGRPTTTTTTSTTTTTTTTTTMPTNSFGNGTWRVGADIKPGTYRMLSDGSSCYWARLSGFGGTLDEIIANEFSDTVEIVTILSSDAGFESSRCNLWTDDLSPRRSKPAAPWLSDGHLMVGSEIAAGTWRNSGLTGYCYWERLSGFEGTFGEIIANDFTQDPSIVTISASDAGFFADRDCGTWTKIS